MCTIVLHARPGSVIERRETRPDHYERVALVRLARTHPKDYRLIKGWPRGRGKMFVLRAGARMGEDGSMVLYRTGFFYGATDGGEQCIAV